MKHQLSDSAASPRYTGPERRQRKPLLTMRLRDFTVGQAADHMLGTRRTVEQGVGLFATPNIQHVSDMRSDPEFAAAMRSAQIAVCDGFPVYLYAQLRGQRLPGRVTGREVVDRMLAQPARLAEHRLFFVVDGDETARAITAWMTEHVPAAAIRTLVPPFGFDGDRAYSADLAEQIAGFGTTLLFLCVGAPRSEVFVYRHRALLPPCWALCIGQSFKIALGMTTPPPALMVRLNLEWLWRIVLEPRRMLRRYGPSSLGFLASVIADLWRGRGDRG